MNERNIQKALSSDDSDVILDGLFALGGQTTPAPSQETLRQALAHFGSADTDVRRQAIFAVAIRWTFAPAFTELLRLADSEKDDYVAEAVLSAIAAMSKNHPALKDRALGSLRKVCLDQTRSRRLKSLAFVQARAVAGKTNARQLAAELLDPEKVPFDRGWLDEIGSKCPDPQDPVRE